MKTRLLILSLILIFGLVLTPLSAPAQSSSNSHKRIMDLLTGEEEGNRINIWFGAQTAETSEVNFLWHAFFITADEKGTQSEFLPIDFEFFLDEVQMDVKFSMILFPNSAYYTDTFEPTIGERSDPILFYYSWYFIFEADSVSPGDYEWTIKYYSQHEMILSFTDIVTFV